MTELSPQKGRAPIPEQQIPASEHKGGMSKGAKIGSMAAAGVLAAAGGAAIAYESGVFDSGDGEANVLTVPAQEQPAVIPGTEIPNPLKTPVGVAATAEATPTTIPPTATKEAVKDVPCQILPEEFCSRGERVVSVSNGKNYTYVGFHLPPGTPLFSLIDGLLLKAVEGGNPYSGFLAQVRDDTQSHGYAFRGDIAFDNMLQRNVKAGDKIANIGNSGVTNLGGYNFIFTINTPGPVTDEEMLETLFPAAYNRPIVGTNIPEGEMKSAVIPSYSSEPPVTK